MHHPIIFWLGGGRGWGGSTSDSAAGSVGIARNSCIKPRESSYPAFFFVEGGLGRFDFGFGFGFVSIANNFRAQPSKPFFIWREKGG